MNIEIAQSKYQGWHSCSGRTVIETLMVLTVAAVMTAVTLPQVISGRRLMRSAQLPREVVTQLRQARQQAMSQRQAFTFQYDDSAKQVKIIDHNNNGNANPACNIAWATLVADASFPNTACSTTVLTVPLTGGSGIPSSELTFGVPSAISSSSTLDDTTTPTSLTSNKLNITFQPNGTVIDAAGNPLNRTMFFYNNKASQETAVAISVLGAAGRVKIWRYDSSANKFAE